MPTYMFACKTCGEEFQAKMSWQEKAQAKCPACGGDQLKELLGRYSLHVAPARNTAGVPEQCRGCSHPGPSCPVH